MNRKINISLVTFKILYNKYKDYLLSAFVILVCIILLFKILIPQVFALLSAQEQKKQEQEKLITLRSNLSLLTSLNGVELDSELQTASDALPPGKDAASILNAISVSAARSGVFLGDYEFQIGDLSKTSSNIKNFPSLQLILTVSGNLGSVMRFINEFYRTVPISEVTNVQLKEGRSLITIVFYYKSLPQLKFNAQAQIKPVSSSDLSLLKNISSWNNPKNQSVPTGTSSGTPSSPF